METLTIGRWTLRCDPEATRVAYSKIQVGSAETCTCDYCKNLIAARHEAYPPEAIAIFDLLGIHSHKEAETWEWNRIEPKLHSYGGFFHFIGTIESGEDAVHREGACGTFRLERVGEYFEYGITSETALIEEAFKGHQVTQLEFTTVVPWLIGEPDPD